MSLIPALPDNQPRQSVGTTRRIVPPRARGLTTSRGLMGLCGLAAGVGGLLGLAGCTSPLQRESEKSLRESLRDSVDREVREARRSDAMITLSRVNRVSELNLKPEILKELESRSGIGSYISAIEGSGAKGILMGPSLLGGEQRAVAINLQRAITTAVENNLNVQFARLSPAIAEARMQTAEAAFDWTIFSTVQWNSTDTSNINVLTTPPSQPSFDQRQVVQSAAGIRQRTSAGGTFTVQQNLDYTDNRTRGVFAFPNPGASAALQLQFDQPLLRNFGSDVALAEVYQARNAERDNILQLRAELTKTITDTERAYWDVVRAAGDLQILRRLLDRGIDAREIVKTRILIDANPAQFANAASAVEQRRALIIQAENAVREASDRLKQLMNDPEITVGSETLLLPVDRPVDAPITFSFADLVLTGMRERPEIQRALLGIDDASIRLRVAESGRLPQLDLRAQIRFNALARSSETALSKQLEAQFVDYLVGAAFELPIGNRAAEGEFRRRSLERIQSVLTYRDVVRTIVADIKSNLRQVITAYELIEQQHAARIAAAEQLRALDAREQTVDPLTPERLDFKLRTQEELAQRERAELAAIVEYNTRVSILYGAVGTALQRNRIRFEVPRNVGEQAPSLR